MNFEKKVKNWAKRQGIDADFFGNSISGFFIRGFLFHVFFIYLSYVISHLRIFYFMFSHWYDLIAQFTTIEMTGIISVSSPSRRERLRINEKKKIQKNPDFSSKKKFFIIVEITIILHFSLLISRFLKLFRPYQRRKCWLN